MEEVEDLKKQKRSVALIILNTFTERICSGGILGEYLMVFRVTVKLIFVSPPSNFSDVFDTKPRL
jgi:hypothetical protein